MMPSKTSSEKNSLTNLPDKLLEIIEFSRYVPLK
jgi:hypothetical protein